MEFKNGYKVVYEVAANGQRTFYATKSNNYPPRDENGNIVENEENTVLATFDDTNYRNRTIYEYKGSFYVSAAGATPRYNEDGTPADDRIAGFDAVLVEQEAGQNSEQPETPVQPEEEDTPAAPSTEDPVVEDEEPEAEEPAGDDEE